MKHTRRFFLSTGLLTLAYLLDCRKLFLPEVAPDLRRMLALFFKNRIPAARMGHKILLELPHLDEGSTAGLLVARQLRLGAVKNRNELRQLLLDTHKLDAQSGKFFSINSYLLTETESYLYIIASESLD